MPSKSIAQQRFFGVVKGIQKGSGKGRGKAKKAADNMDPKDVDDFASTKHKGLPNRVKQETKVRELIRKMVREIMNEDKTVRISKMKDVQFRRGIARILGKKGVVVLDKKSMKYLMNAIRQNLGHSFAEGKINEAKVVKLPNGVKVKISFNGVELHKPGKKPVFLDRGELPKFSDAVRKYMGEGFAGGLPKAKRKAFDTNRQKQSEVLGFKLTGKKDVKTEIGNVHPDEYKPHYRVQKLKETKKRDYKAEYKKYGSSKKAKKYRAELNAYNRKKGTYGNGDGKDASHKGGKIVGFEKESVNRGRREKSRLKKEGKLKEGVEPKGGMAKIAAIVKNKQHGKVGGKTVDMQSANLLMKLYNAVKDKDKEKMNKMNEKKLIVVLHKLWSRVNLKLPV